MAVMMVGVLGLPKKAASETGGGAKGGRGRGGGNILLYLMDEDGDDASEDVDDIWKLAEKMAAIQEAYGSLQV